MPRFKLTLAYDGTAFVGWQRQANGRAVQQALEEAILAITGETVTVWGAGRTDAGVHALGQVAHVDLTRGRPGDRLRDAINAGLKMADDAVAIIAAEPVDETFEARFSATGRRYLYRVFDRRAPCPFEKGRAWHVYRRLDADAMHKAAQRLLGHHDFSTFRAAECQADSPMRTLDVLDVTRAGDIVEIRASARSFLHRQVRSLVGSLRLVGDGKWTGDDLEAALHAANRAACGPVAPPEGLYLTSVDYG